MFSFGLSELLVIFAIALIVFGPKKLPEIAKSLGKAVGSFKRTLDEVKKEVDITGIDMNLDSEKEKSNNK